MTPKSTANKKGLLAKLERTADKILANPLMTLGCVVRVARAPRTCAEGGRLKLMTPFS